MISSLLGGGGFTTSVDRQRIDAVLNRAVRSDLWTLSGKSDAHASRTSATQLSHHRTMVLDSVHILSSYRNAQLISLTVTSWCECCTRTPTRPSLFFTLPL